MLFAGFAAAIVIGCMLPARLLPPLPNDKLLHFLAFGGLTLLAARIAASGTELSFWLAGLFLAGLAIEAAQKWVPGRRFCWRDLGANTAGIALAALVSWVPLANTSLA